jgi:hypothetical protein
MNRRKFLGMSLGAAGVGVAVTAAAGSASIPLRWRDMTKEQRAAFSEASEAAWNERRDEVFMAEYRWKTYGINPKNGKLEAYEVD